MPDPAPPGILPMFLRGVTAEKYGFKTGEGITDLVDSILIPKAKILDEITVMGVMSDFEPAKKHLEAYPEDEVLYVIDKGQQYGEMFLLCYTVDARQEFERKVREAAEAIEAQKRAAEEAEAARVAAEYARLNAVYEDKPIEPRPWVTETAQVTQDEVDLISVKVAYREPIVLEITRPKRQLGSKLQLYDRKSDVSGIAEWRAVKDPNFKQVIESDMGFQAAPCTRSVTAQTTWNRTVNKSIQYESISIGPDGEGKEESYNKEQLLSFLEKATVAVEKALQQNESVDIFNETFQIVGDDDTTAGASTDNELKELKNFADPQYSKSKCIVAIDWLPKTQGMVTVSPLRNITFDQRAAVSGQTHTSHLLIWDFRQLVKPAAVLKCNQEILCFRSNPTNPSLMIGGCITGQVVLWDISSMLAAQQKKGRNNQDDDGEDSANVHISPFLTSSIDYSHKKPVSDLFWLPANTQINHRGQLVNEEHLDGQQYQFVTISGDGTVMVWDTRYEKIAVDELKHIGRSKHVPVEKSSKSDEPKYLWGPIFKAPLKRTEGLGELSLNKVSCSGLLPAKLIASKDSQLAGDPRSHLILGTEEGDVMFVDLCVAPSGGNAAHHEEEEEGKEVPSNREFVRWMLPDHSRPSVAIQQSPFFADIVLTVSDWAFHIWQVGKDKPIYVSPNHAHYLTCGAWSPTRPAVIILTDSTGHLQVWDFTDTSTRPSVELHATHARITSMEFMDTPEKATTNQQLLAIGDEVGTLHVYEMPRNLIRPVPKEKSIMQAFMAREWKRIEYVRHIPEIHGFAAAAGTTAVHAEEFALDVEEPAADAPSAPHTAPGASLTALDSDAIPDAEDSTAAQRKALREALKREEEEFLKLEAMFVSELNLNPADIQESIRVSMVQLSEKDKEKLAKEKGR